MTKFGPKKFLRINNYEKPTKKEGKKKEVLEGCIFFLFSCCFLMNVDPKTFFWSQFGRNITLSKT